jgi:hypothetical protein
MRHAKYKYYLKDKFKMNILQIYFSARRNEFIFFFF